ncbi:MAG TPA: hypothetical protein VHS99_12490 [Chloroflexota bacterium]|jgi:hypothetical protein|nr:hypothetical protein [Chloroflexota bacterium]
MAERPVTAPAEAAAAWWRREVVPVPYVERTVGGYRALCRRLAPREIDGEVLELLLLMGEDGAAYVPHPAGESLPGETQDPEVAAGILGFLRAQRLRPTTTSLVLRLPPHVRLPGGAAQPARFTLWASPAYLAARGLPDTLWK